MVKLAIIIIFLWFPWYISIFKELLSLVHTWQVKEYRLDKVFAMFYDIDWRNDKRFILLIIEFILFLIGLQYFWFPKYNALLIAVLIAFIIFVYRSIDFVKILFDRSITYPDFSIRNVIVVVLTGIVLCLPLALTMGFTFKVMANLGVSDISFRTTQQISLDTFYSTKENENLYIYPFETILILLSALFWLSFDILIPVIVGAFVILTYPLAHWKRSGVINRAKKAIISRDNLKVIGITGSYGKTTTKNILYEILKNKFKVVKTPRNYNSDLGISITINNEVKPDTEILIAEMAAYKRGEIKACCDVAKPDIAIVTGVNEEHLALFKNLQNTLLTKYEIVEHSKDDSTIILNADNEFTLKMAEMTTKDTVMFSTTKEVDIYAQKIDATAELLSFDVIAKDKKEHFDVQILGEHNVVNILAAVAAAMKMGMSLSEIAKELKNAGNLGRLNFRDGINGSKIIDDSYNSNPAGFLSAIEFMHNTAGKDARKVLITSGILELGKDKEGVYERMKKSILSGVDVVITSDAKLYKLLKLENIKLYYTPAFNDQVRTSKNIIQQGDTVLFEGANASLYKKVVIS